MTIPFSGRRRWPSNRPALRRWQRWRIRCGNVCAESVWGWWCAVPTSMSRCSRERLRRCRSCLSPDSRGALLALREPVHSCFDAAYRATPKRAGRGRRRTTARGYVADWFSAAVRYVAGTCDVVSRRPPPRAPHMPWHVRATLDQQVSEAAGYTPSPQTRPRNEKDSVNVFRSMMP